MAATFNITDGSTTVNLISAKVDYQLLFNSLEHSEPDYKQIRRDSIFDEGEALVSSQPKNVTETFEVSLYGATQNAVATNLQKLQTLARRAREKESTLWQITPVYMTKKSTNETGTLYSPVVDIRFPKLSSLLSKAFNNQTMLPKIVIVVERAPYWQGTIPQTLPTALTTSAPQAPSPQSVATEQFVANFRDTNALTHVVNGDASNTLAASQESLKAYWTMDEVSGNRADSFGANTLIDNNSVGSNTGKVSNAAQFVRASSRYLRATDNADLSMADVDFCMSLWVYLDTKTDNMVMMSKGTADTVGGLEFRLLYETSSDRFRWLVSNGTTATQVNADALGAVSTATWYHLYVWHDSTNNIIGIRVNDTNENTAAHTVGSQDTSGEFRFGRTAGSGTDYYNGRIDEAALFRGRILTSAEITGFYNAGSGTGYSFQYSANQITSTSFNYYPASPAANDTVYFGSTTGPFKYVVLRLGTAGSYVATVTWEWWNGANWVSTANGIQETNTFTTTGNRMVGLDVPTAWATKDIAGATAYWIRARISAFTSWTTSPAQSGQVVYNPRDAYISIASTQILGDADALALIRFTKYFATLNGWRFVAMGLKARGLTAFTSRLNAGGENPTGWTATYGTDSSAVADVLSPSGSHGFCNFTSDQTMVTRVQIACSTVNTLEDFEGDYHAYIRCQQIGGSAGAVSVRLAYGDGNLNLHVGTQTLVSVDSGIELVSMGRLRIISPRVLESSENGPTALQFYIQASATSATPDLRVYDLILMPIDEWSMVGATDSRIVSSNLPSMNASGAMIECDAGVIRRKVTTKTGGSSNNIQSEWEARGVLPKLPPDKNLQIHFLFSDYSNTDGMHESDNAFGGSVIVFTHNRWAWMRGSE